ncbi:MAG: carboxyl transferase domain-containing protein [Pseudomonadales bacterium]|jgi:acetyl/propionyl-CoA carboxylase alpha subunit/acetyl-CoA carboxylase carboxyltransferase component|nr:carboxyl transferase domain-containing protein [Pseudomonadales bacterium]MDP7595483.1 carboxyl transferase domain-containing protein [Pseudomonadales bacterium]
MKLLVANRGEIAIRIMRAAAELNILTVAVAPKDDAGSLHTGKADEAVTLEGTGTAAYLDISQLVAVARESDCDAIHPGYGFLAENADLARTCAEDGLTFIGPRVDTLELFGDKARARVAATAARVPIIRGLDHAVSPEEAAAFFDEIGGGRPRGRRSGGRGMIIKAAHGGGGRGSRVVERAGEVAATYQRCRAEAQAAFGNGDLYVEEFIQQARHVEVQILGDVHGAIAHLGERECSVQRYFQKIIEVAPAPGLADDLRSRIIEAAVRLADSVSYSNAGTFEFLVDVSGNDNEQPFGEPFGEPFSFIDTNARLQVEHTVTEAVTGVDIVQAQIRLAEGASIAELGLDGPQVAKPRGYAIQARVCMESIREDGSIYPASGTLSAYEAPTGPGVRTDGFGYSGYKTSLSFDSLLAKVIGHSPSASFADTIARTSRALSEFRIEGVDTNIAFLQSILAHQDFASGSIDTRFVDNEMTKLATASAAHRRFVTPPGYETSIGVIEQEQDAAKAVGPAGSVGLVAPMQGTIVEISVDVGDEVRIGQTVAVVEAMKLQHDIKAERSGVVCAISMSVDDIVREGYPIVFIEEMDIEGGAIDADAGADLDHIRGDLQEVNERIDRTLDDFQQEAVAAQHAMGRRTARENLADLLDEGSFREFGPPASGSAAGGTIMGIGSVNADLIGEERGRVAIVHNDSMLTAYTHGHYRQEQIHELARDFRVPLVLFSEGEGRPAGNITGVGMDASVFTEFAQLSGLVPLVGVNTGDCFAGNATLLSCCDVIIATESSTIGANGPAVTKASGMGTHSLQDLGSMSFQVSNGNVDILVKDDAAAVATVKTYLGYFQGPIDHWEAPDQRRMRHIIPENRVRTYDMREIINTLADEDSVLEIRQEFGIGVITAFIRVEGKPLGVVANNPAHLAGAIDSPGADNGARFFQLCDAFDIPTIVLMDCPGIMVGPDHERTALVRHSVRLFNIGANLTTPVFGVMVRKAYGLGVQAMIGGAASVPFFTVAWPTAEFAGMNIDGAVKLSARRELSAIEDPEERIAAYDRRVAQGYETARAINSGARYVIDPAETRAWVVRGLKSLPPTPPRTGKKRPYVDTW